MKFKKNRKLSTIIACIACLLTLTAGIFANSIFADEAKTYDLTVSSGYVPEAEVPLTTKVSTTEFYFNGNINPADTLSADILFENTSSEDAIQVTISEIRNLLGDDDAALDLLDQLELTIAVDDKIIYQGSHGKTTMPVIGWIEIPAGETITVHISVYFPKESDNTYQNSPLKVKYIFESRIDIPSDITETTTEFSEQIKTGLDSISQSNISMFIIGLGVVLILIYIIFLIVKAIKKKNKDKDEDKKDKSVNDTETK